MDAYELAKKYYPQLWGKERLDTLFEKGLLTKDQYNELLGQS